MNKEHEADLHWFKKVYKYLTEERGWTAKEVAIDTQLNHLTVQKFVKMTKQDLEVIKMRASTLAKVQDWIKKWKSDVLAMDGDCSEAELGEAIADIVEENGRKGNIETPEIQPTLLAEADTWDMLRVLSQRKEVNLSVSITMTT